jgi:cytochrome P450
LLLSQHPKALAKARAELDSVFGTDSSQTGALIKQNPSLINSLQFIPGAVKETLRLFPPIMTVREGQGTITSEGITYDIGGYMMLLSTHTIHRNAEYFPSSDEFIPERWGPWFRRLPTDPKRCVQAV